MSYPEAPPPSHPPTPHPPLLRGVGGQWYLVQSKPRQEEKALENLERQGYVCYLPRYRVQRVRRSKTVWIEEPLFARYLFIYLHTTGDQVKSWAPIRSTIGVQGLVKFGSAPAKVDAALIEALQQQESSLPEATRFVSGDKVRITQGPFVGIEAIYQYDNAEQRAMVLIEMMSKPITLAIDHQVLKISI